MNNIQTYNSVSVVPRLANSHDFTEMEDPSNTSMLKPILKRWRLFICTFLIVCMLGLPAIWFTVDSLFQTTAAIRVAPVISSILFGSEEGLPMYKNFMYTQADLMASDKVLQRVADDLIDKKLTFFKEPDNATALLRRKFFGLKPNDPISTLKNALNSQTLTIIPEQNTELIKVNMKGRSQQEMEQIVNAFVRAYMAIVVSEEAKDPDQKLAVLENERRVITTKLERQQETIRQIAQEYGTQALSGRQEMMLQRVAALQDELTKYQMRKIALQVQVQLLESQKEYPLPPEDVLKLRHTFINSDMMVQTMITNIVELEQALIVAKQILAPMNPEIRRKTELVEALRQRLEQRRKEVDEEFSKMIAESMAKSDEKHLANTKIELEQIVAYENQLKSILDQEDADTIEVGRKQLAIQDLQNQLNLTRELYETINRRIQELEMERKRPARVSVAYYASSSLSPNKRKKYAIAVIFAAAAIGVMLALLKDKTDMSLRTPKDVAKRVGIQIIGTTTRSDTARKALPPGHLADDYQTICANLGLLTSQGIPKRIVISSPCPKDGKTTFAINLAISIAKTGKAVLLIDGDLRKPDIARLLSLTYPRNGIAELLRGKSLEQVRISLLSAGIDVVTANPANSSGIYRLITQKQTPDIIKAVSQKYDHIIIDSPPVLAVPDALLWARMADGVVLTSFAGHTESSDLKEAIQKLEQINISLIGTVLNNVDVNYNYNPYYGYEYTQNGTRDRKISRKKKTNAVLLPMQE